VPVVEWYIRIQFDWLLICYITGWFFWSGCDLFTLRETSIVFFLFLFLWHYIHQRDFANAKTFKTVHKSINFPHNQPYFLDCYLLIWMKRLGYDESIIDLWTVWTSRHLRSLVMNIIVKEKRKEKTNTVSRQSKKITSQTQKIKPDVQSTIQSNWFW